MSCLITSSYPLKTGYSKTFSPQRYTFIFNYFMHFIEYICVYPQRVVYLQYRNSQNDNIMENLVRTKIQVSDLEIGMTVEHNGNLYTIGKESIRKTDHGMAFNGDASSKIITRVQFSVPTINGTVLR